MPDHRLGPADAARLVGTERRSAQRFDPPGQNRDPSRSPSTGLPLVSTAPLTIDERVALRQLDRVLRLAAERVTEAIELGRVDRALEACSLVDEVGLAAARVATTLGSRR